jgi:hypothetical protein
VILQLQPCLHSRSNSWVYFPGLYALPSVELPNSIMYARNAHGATVPRPKEPSIRSCPTMILSRPDARLIDWRCPAFHAAHTISGFLVCPTIVKPSTCIAFGSFTRTINGAGSIGLSGLIWAASLAACSIASISSLQPAWSKGQTTMGWRRRISFAALNWAFENVSCRTGS